MSARTSNTTELPNMKQLNPLLSAYQTPSWKNATWQIIDSVVPYLFLCWLMSLSLSVSYWLTLLLAIPAGGFMIRVFILFHDCGHNSFTPSKQANKIIGFILGVITFTPSEQWWHSHALHHATSGNLDKRGVGDVMTWTLEEFQSRPWYSRLGYRLFRLPAIMFGLGPLWMFVISNRLPFPQFNRKATLSVLWTNLCLVGVATGWSLLLGSFWKYLMVQLPILWVAGMVGIWLFYVQHQFEGVYWAKNGEWNYVASAMKGASYYQLPKILQWITGNIGFHHIHHLSPRIPNYRLEACYDSSPVFQQDIKRITFGEAFKTVRLRLIDEARGNRMISFREIFS